jgi:hypothetical protein
VRECVCVCGNGMEKSNRGAGHLAAQGGVEGERWKRRGDRYNLAAGTSGIIFTAAQFAVNQSMAWWGIGDPRREA